MPAESSVPQERPPAAAETRRDRPHHPAAERGGQAAGAPQATDRTPWPLRRWRGVRSGYRPPGFPGGSVGRGLLVTLVAVAAFEALNQAVVRLPTLAALLAVVAFVAFSHGLVPGLVSAIVVSVYGVHYFADPDQPFQYSHDNALRLVILPATAVAVAAIVGTLRRSLGAAEARLRRERDLARAIDASLDEGVYALDPEGRVTFLNPAAERLLGWTEAELRGKVMHDAVHFRYPDGRPYPREVCAGLQVLRTGVPYRTEDEAFVRRDGTLFPIAFSSAPIKVDGRVVGAVVAFRDVSERKRAERRLATQYEVSRVLAEATDLAEATPKILAAIAGCLGWDYGALWTIDRRAGALRCVDSWHAPGAAFPELEATNRRTAFAPGEGLPGRAWAEGRPAWVPDATKEANFPRLEVAAREGLRGGFALPVVIGQDVVGVIEFFGREVCDRDPELLEMAAALGGQIGQFVERTRAEAAARESGERRGAILASAFDAIITIDHNGRIVEFNPAAERTFAYSRAEAIGQEMARLIVPPALRERHREGLARCLAGGEGPILDRRVEMTAMRADGTEFPVELAVTRVPAEGPPLFTGFVRDITDRRQAEETLRARARQQAAVADLGQRALAMPDLGAVMEEAVTTVARTLDVERCKLLELLPGGDVLLLRAGVGWGAEVGRATLPTGADSQGGYTLLVGGPVISHDLGAETRFRPPSLLLRHGVVSTMSVVVPGEPAPFGVLQADATEARVFTDDDANFLRAVANVLAAAIHRKEVEERLAREQAEAERLAVLDRLRGEFLQSVSHDLKTPLTAVRAAVGILQVGDVAADEREQLLANARRNVERLGMLVDDLLTANQLEAGVLRLDVRAQDLRGVVAEAVAAVHPLIEQKGQTLELDLPESLPVQGDPKRLEQAIINLLANAHAHTPAGTRIGVAGRVADGEVQLAVTDDGPGIPAEELEAVFERFRRLTPGGRGSGLGLAIARGLVELHGGRVWAESAPGGGATFRVALPRADGGSP